MGSSGRQTFEDTELGLWQQLLTDSRQSAVWSIERFDKTEDALVRLVELNGVIVAIVFPFVASRAESVETPLTFVALGVAAALFVVSGAVAFKGYLDAEDVRPPVRFDAVSEYARQSEKEYCRDRVLDNSAFARRMDGQRIETLYPLWRWSLTTFVLGLLSSILGTIVMLS